MSYSFVYHSCHIESLFSIDLSICYFALSYWPNITFSFIDFCSLLYYWLVALSYPIDLILHFPIHNWLIDLLFTIILLIVGSIDSCLSIVLLIWYSLILIDFASLFFYPLLFIFLNFSIELLFFVALLIIFIVLLYFICFYFDKIYHDAYFLHYNLFLFSGILCHLENPL